MNCGCPTNASPMLGSISAPRKKFAPYKFVKGTWDVRTCKYTPFSKLPEKREPKCPPYWAKFKNWYVSRSSNVCPPTLVEYNKDMCRAEDGYNASTSEGKCKCGQPPVPSQDCFELALPACGDYGVIDVPDTLDLPGSS